MNRTNYIHSCSNDLKCTCGWVGCWCKTKIKDVKITDKEYETHSICPNCNFPISHSTTYIT